MTPDPLLDQENPNWEAPIRGFSNSRFPEYFAVIYGQIDQERRVWDTVHVLWGIYLRLKFVLYLTVIYSQLYRESRVWATEWIPLLAQIGEAQVRLSRPENDFPESEACRGKIEIDFAQIGGSRQIWDESRWNMVLRALQRSIDDRFVRVLTVPPTQRNMNDVPAQAVSYGSISNIISGIMLGGLCRFFVPYIAVCLLPLTVMAQKS